MFRAFVQLPEWQHSNIYAADWGCGRSAQSLCLCQLVWEKRGADGIAGTVKKPTNSQVTHSNKIRCDCFSHSSFTKLSDSCSVKVFNLFFLSVSAVLSWRGCVKFSRGCLQTHTARYLRLPLSSSRTHLHYTHTCTHTSARHTPAWTASHKTAWLYRILPHPQPVFSPQTQIHTLRHVQCTLTLGLKTVANRMVWFEWISDFRQFARLFSTTVTPDVQTSSVAFLPFLLALTHTHTRTVTIPQKKEEHLKI